MESDRDFSDLLGVLRETITTVGEWTGLSVLLAPACAGEVETKTIYNLSNKVDESSGIVASRTYKDVFWTHEDNGLSNNLYAVDEKGDFLFKADVAGAKNVDWEDIAIDDEG